MKAVNRNKIKAIGKKLMYERLKQYGLEGKEDKEYAEALIILKKAIDEIERLYPKK